MIFKKMSRVCLIVILFLSCFGKIIYGQETQPVLQQDEKFITALRNIKEKNRLSIKGGDKRVRVIIQTDTVAEIDGGTKERYETIKSDIKKITNNDIVFQNDFSYLVSGFSLDVSEKYVASLSSIKGVKKVSIARTYYQMMSNAVGLTHAQQIWQDRHYKGEGMVVSIIDSGIDITHKDMRLSDPNRAKIQTVKSGFTIKVPYGYNYADGNDIVIDNDAVGKSMHGMHVAGIVAANATDEDMASGNGVRGVAPEAQLLAMKVFSNNSDVGTAYEDAIVSAIEDSVKHGADIINMSLGTDNGFASEDDPEHIAIKKARESGVLVVVSAGNAALSTTEDDHSRIPLNTLGLTDNAAVGSPSTAEHALSVASSNNATETGYYGMLNDTEFVYTVATNAKAWDKAREYAIVDVGLGSADDYTDKDVTGKVAFITRGDITFSEKFSEAINHGAIGIIMANNVEGEFGMAGVDNYAIPSVIVDKATGELLKQKINDTTSKVKIDFHKNDYTGSNEVSSFTSYGPSPELTFKPEVMAPGGHIYSTLNHNTYGNMSGTSMAAPHISGLLALMLGALKQEGITVDDVQRFSTLSLINTATPLIDTAGNTGLPVSPRRQGAGLADVDNALKNKVLITEETGKATKSLKEISGVVSFTLTLTNYSNQDRTYTLDASPVLTETTAEDTKQLRAIPLTQASVSTDKQIVTVPANNATTVQVTLDVSQVSGNQFAQGYVYFKSDQQGVDLVFPYMGFVGDWGAEPILDKPKSETGSVYDTLGLVSGGSYLGSAFDVMTFSEKINWDKVGFSPNDDDNYDSINLILGLLRSAKTLDVDVVDRQSEKAESLIHLTTAKDVKKPLYKDKSLVAFTNGYWDGKVFNEKTGKYEALKDGQYYMRIAASVGSNLTKQQYTYLPFKIDTTKPTLEILSKEYEGDDFVIKFKAVDNDGGIGLAEDGVGAYVDNEEKTTLYDDDDGEEDGVYTYRVPRTSLQDGKPHTITVGAIDEVFNVKTEVIVLDETSVVFYNATNEVIGAKHKFLSEDKATYSLKGHVGKQVAELFINGHKAVIDEDTFTVDLPLHEGENMVTFVGKNAKGEVIVSSNEDTQFTLTKDTEPPTLAITSHDVNVLQTLTSNKITITGKVTDNTNNPISVRAGFTNFTVNPDGTFTGEATVDWTRVLKIVARDSAGNETSLSLNTVFEDEDNAPFNVYMTSGVSAFNYINADSKLVEPNDLLVLEGHVNKKISHLVIGGQVVPVDKGLRFSHRYPLKEINNHISIQAIGLDGQTIYEGSYAVYYDKTMPNITLNGPGTIDNETIYTNKNPYPLKATASDNGHGYRLFINGNEVLNYDHIASNGVLDNEQSKEYAVDSTNGNTLFIEMADNFGNHFTKRYQFVYDNIKPEVSVTGLDENQEVQVSGTLQANANEEAIIEMSIDGQAYHGESLNTPGEYTLTVRATDRAGNVTEKTYPFKVIVHYSFNDSYTVYKPFNKDIDLTSVINVTDSLGNSKLLSHIRVLSTQPLKAGENLLEIEATLPNGKIVKTTVKVDVEVDYHAIVKENAAVYDTSAINYHDLIPVVDSFGEESAAQYRVLSIKQEKDKRVIEVEVIYANGKVEIKTVTVTILKQHTGGVEFAPIIENVKENRNQTQIDDKAKQQRVLPKTGQADINVGMIIIIFVLLPIVWKVRKD
ncbi:S8 family serine peptidase [Carnobacteriaceae bacterium zg-84]|uniref:S8 family serine peptidase n=1 Tax=Granulicatella sp. zg-84 TaxID=2678503 RepID=UPI0013D2A4F0|nr:S8 family serine peptidase [Granulicatella sp. zg-84]QMI86407.1 S8 family serine peptidase [Carnobacteriaceae bacterium zg-84]